MYYGMSWGCLSMVIVFAVLGRSFATQHRWLSVLLIVTISLPLIGYVYMFYIYKETALSVYYMVSWGCFSIAFVFAVLGRSFATQHRWFSKVLLFVTIGLPLAGYVFMFSFMKLAK